MRNFEPRSSRRVDSHRGDDLRHLLRGNPDHSFDQAVLLDLADRRAQHALAVAQHGDSVAHVIDLLQMMGDVEDTDPATFETADPFKQAFDGGLL